MNIQRITPKPALSSIRPELELEAELEFQQQLETPLDITGAIFSEDGMKISAVQSAFEKDKRFKLSAMDSGNPNTQGYISTKTMVSLNGTLDSKALDHIDTLRAKGKKGDVILTVDLSVRALYSKTTLSYMFPKDSGIAAEQSKPVHYQYQRGFSPQMNNMWILSGDSGPTFLEIGTQNFKLTIIIPSSDWVHDYCPVFQIGKFSVFEYLLPDYVKGSGSIQEKLTEAINAVKKMEEDIVKDEWNDVIEDSRAVWELVRSENEMRELLKKDGFTEEAITDLFGGQDSNGNKHNGCLTSLFNFSSKFLHKLDKGQRIQADIKASKEDAYLIYGIAVSVVNLISKKMQRQSKSR